MTELEELYEFFYLTPVGLAKIGIDGNVEQINPFMVNILMTIDSSYSIHNNIFKSIGQYDSEFIEECIKLKDNETRRAIDNRIVTINTNDILKLRLKITKIVNDRFIIVAENISDYIRANEEKERITEELNKQQDRLAKIGQVIRAVVHDLRNPISNIKTISDMVEIASIEEAKQLMTENINVILNEINGIINDMLDYTRAEIPRLEMVNILVISYHLKMKFELTAKESGVNIVYRCEDDFEIQCDEAKILRIFSNITGNAVKALVSHNIENPEIQVLIEKKDNNMFIKISDNGGGIPQELADKLFEPFAFKSGYVGNGIGLPIVKNIIDMHKGDVSVKSDKSGTVFCINIPLISQPDLLNK